MLCLDAQLDYALYMKKMFFTPLLMLGSAPLFSRALQ